MTFPGQGINNGLPYKYVVGTGGNYPATPAGLQAATDDASATSPTSQAPAYVFVKTNIPDGTSVQMRNHVWYKGPVNAMPGGAVISQQGQIYIDINTPFTETTHIYCPLLLPNDSGSPQSLGLINLIYDFPGTTAFDGSGGGFRQWYINIRGSVVRSFNSGSIFYKDAAAGEHQPVFLVEDSLIHCYKLYDLSTSGGGSLIPLIYANSNSVISAGQSTSPIAGAVSPFICLNGGYFCAALLGDGTTSAEIESIGSTTFCTEYGFPLCENMDNLLVSNCNTTYMSPPGLGGGAVVLFKDITTIQVGNISTPVFASDVTLSGTVWSNSQAQINDLYAQTALVTDAGGNIHTYGAINAATVKTSPPSSNTATAAFAASLTLGTPLQNTTGYDLLATVGFQVASATAATIVMGVGSGATPTTGTIIPTFTTAVVNAFSISAVVPSGYYLLVDKTGTISATNAIVATPL